MPCNSEYLSASELDIELSRVACLLGEFEGTPIDKSHWRGYHPAVYNKLVDRDALVSELCRRLQSVDVTKYSLEMQIWWRDHQAADKARIEREMEKMRSAEERAAALSKLTPHERKLLGL